MFGGKRLGILLGAACAWLLGHSAFAAVPLDFAFSLDGDAYTIRTEMRLPASVSLDRAGWVFADARTMQDASDLIETAWVDRVPADSSRYFMNTTLKRSRFFVEVRRTFALGCKETASASEWRQDCRVQFEADKDLKAGPQHGPELFHSGGTLTVCTKAMDQQTQRESLLCAFEAFGSLRPQSKFGITYNGRDLAFMGAEDNLQLLGALGLVLQDGMTPQAANQAAKKDAQYRRGMSEYSRLTKLKLAQGVAKFTVKGSLRTGQVSAQ